MRHDCPELQYTAKELSREMNNPKIGCSWKRLNKVARFIVKRRRVVWRFEWQFEVDTVEIYSDSFKVGWGGGRGELRAVAHYLFGNTA